MSDPEDEYKVAAGLCTAAKRGDLQTLKRKMDSGVNMSQADYDGRTALHLAATYGRTEIVQYLIKDCKCDPTMRDNFNKTATDCAKESGHGETEDAILDCSRSIWPIDPNESLPEYKTIIKSSRMPGYTVRVNVIGPPKAGKTTLTKIILNESHESVDSTNGIDIHRFKASLMKDGSVKKGEKTIGETPIKRLACTGDLSSTDGLPEDARDQATNPEELRNAYVFDATKNKKRRISSDVNNDGDDFAALMHIWDFGGHYMFHVTHQLFHSKDAVYLLVINVAESLDMKVKDENMPAKSQYFAAEQSVKDHCVYWIKSIHSFVGTKDERPSVILVGTHKDLMEGDESKKREKCKKIFDEIKESVSDLLIMNETFILDNTPASEQEFNRLKAYIFEIAEQKHKKADIIPSSWIRLERYLKSERVRKYMKVKDLEEKLTDEQQEDITAFLAYGHVQGSLIYFPDGELSAYVVLDPQWIMDGFRQIITSTQFFEVGNQDLLDMRWELYSTGILNQKLIKKVWKDAEDRKVWSMFLSYLGIIAEYTGPDRQRQYIVPSLLPKEDNSQIDPEISEKTGTIEFVFNDRILAKTVYNHITSTLIKKWAPKMQNDDSPMLYLYFRVIQLPDNHIGCMKREDRRIIVYVGKERDIDTETKNQKPPDRIICDHFRRGIEMAIKMTFQKFDVNCDDKYDVCIVEMDQEQMDQEERDVRRESVSVKSFMNQWVADTMLTMTTERRLKEITHQEMARLPASLGKNWELLMYGLGVQQTQVDRIKLDAPHAVATQINRCLVSWKQRVGKGKATWDVLMKEMAQNPSLSINWDMIKSIMEEGNSAKEDGN